MKKLEVWKTTDGEYFENEYGAHMHEVSKMMGRFNLSTFNGLPVLFLQPVEAYINVFYNDHDTALSRSLKENFIHLVNSKDNEHGFVSVITVLDMYLKTIGVTELATVQLKHKILTIKTLLDLILWEDDDTIEDIVSTSVLQRVIEVTGCVVPITSSSTRESDMVHSLLTVIGTKFKNLDIHDRIVLKSVQNILQDLLNGKNE